VRDDFLASIAAYLEYDVLLVNPVMDGLNLVAKEAPLVNRRDGVLVLSREAGAFEELGEWVVPVDPLDVEGQAAALERAIGLPADVRRTWLDGIRSVVRTHDVDAWADRELAELDARAPREDAGATMRA
jgi:trehalose 6-phosphate synthase